jgi:hypothetical protein
MPTRPKITPEETAAKQNIVHHVCDTAMHILHNSYLYGSDMWPKNGFKAGWGIGCKIKDCIYYGVNAYGWDQNPVIGRLAFNLHNVGVRRLKQQTKHIETILDLSIMNDLLYEQEFRNSNWFDHPLWFKFTYTPTSK